MFVGNMLSMIKRFYEFLSGGAWEIFLYGIFLASYLCYMSGFIPACCLKWPFSLGFS